MKQSLLLLLLCLLSFVQIRAQGTKIQDNKITVKDFYLDEKDGAANREPTIVYDQNGEKCALIKIITNIDGFSFDVGVLGVVETHQKPGEYWVYVPQGVKKITISHEIYEKLVYNLPYSTLKSKTYKMTLSSKEIFDNVVDDNTRQGHLKFEVYPSNATVILNYIPVVLDGEGTGEMDLYYGRYSYKISADEYLPSVGKVRINSADSIQTIKVWLKQDFGWLTINSKEGIDSTSRLFIDNKEIPFTRTDSIHVKPGEHTLRIVNPLYITHSKTFTMQDSTVVPVEVTLTPNYGRVSFKADNISHIYSDSTYLGTGNWEGRLPIGKHIIECRADGHLSSYQEITITKESSDEYYLQPPTPVYGIVDINSTPQGAEVYIDNVLIGQTPLTKGNVLVGKRKITLLSQDYSAKNAILEVFKDSISKASYTLSNNMFVKINTTPDSSSVFIDGVYMGNTPFADTIKAGSYHLKLTNSKRYRPVDKLVRIDRTSTDLEFALKRDFVRRNEFYLEGVYSLGTISSYGAAIGCYIANFNIEGGCTITEDRSEDIYWNPINNDDPYSYEACYSPNYFWGKIGYGFSVSSNVRITPQIGVQIASLVDNYGYYSDIYYGEQSNSTSCTIGGRINFAFGPFMGLSFTPEYRIQIQESEGYKILSDISSSIKDFNNGIVLKFGLYFYF